MKLPLFDVLAVVAALSVVAPLGCSTPPAAAPPEDPIVAPPTTTVVASGDARPAPAAAPGVDETPVRSSTPATGPAPAPTTTDAERQRTAPTEAASPAPASEATPPGLTESASSAPSGTELAAAPGLVPGIDPAGTVPEPTPPAVPEPVSTDPAPPGTELAAAPGSVPGIDPAGTVPEPTPQAVPEPVSADPAPSGAEPTPTPGPEFVAGATVTGADAGVGDPASTSPAAAPGAPAVVVLRREPLSFERALDVAARLAPHIVVPNSCELPPLGDPTLLPNATREYRSGTHQGVDFMCPERGRAAIAALDGHVVVAVGDYENPSSGDLDEVLATARRLQATPPYTLVMLYGNHVVVDHGIIDDVGHVVSIYAHLDTLDAAIGIGRPVAAGQLLGWVGNSGTNTAAAGALDWSLHLHWELHVDDQYLGAGLSATETRTVYTTLFSEPAEDRNDHPG